MSWLLSRLRASPLSEMGSGSGSEVFVRCRAWWKGCDVSPQAAFPNYKPALVHRKHRFKAHTYGVQKQSLLRCIDNSKIGREAMAEGRPPKVIKVYTHYHDRKPHSGYGKLGDRVLMSVKGEKIQGIIVGLKQNQLPGIPRFDSNNVVLIDETGSPLGTRIHAPLPNFIRPVLKSKSHPKRADYTKLLAIATRFV